MVSASRKSAPICTRCRRWASPRRETWMIGDNLEWEVEAPQRLGIYAIWMDVHGEGLPAGSTVKPDRIIRSLTELLPIERG